MSIGFPHLNAMLTSGIGLAASTISSVLSPALSTATYLFPKLGVLWHATQIRNRVDESQEHIVSQKKRIVVLDKIEQLKAAAGISRNVLTYISTKKERIYANFGGRYSLGSPIVEVPQFDLFRNNGFGVFGAERYSGALQKNTWRLTDNETSFLILREFGHLKQNDTLLKLAAKIVMAVAILLFQFSSIGWMITGAIFGGALLGYLLVERIYEETLDRFAVSALTRHLVVTNSGTEDNAIDSAIRVLKKFQAQNLFHRKHSIFGKLLISEQGNSRFENKPSFTTRIERLEKRRVAVREAINNLHSYPTLAEIKEGFWSLFSQIVPTTG